jgi:hypothetical protein
VSQAAVVDEVAQSDTGLDSAQTVQVEFRLHAESAAREFAKRASADGWPMKPQPFATHYLRGLRIVRETFA